MIQITSKKSEAGKSGQDFRATSLSCQCSLSQPTGREGTQGTPVCLSVHSTEKRNNNQCISDVAPELRCSHLSLRDLLAS